MPSVDNFQTVDNYRKPRCPGHMTTSRPGQYPHSSSTSDQERGDAPRRGGGLARGVYNRLGGGIEPGRPHSLFLKELEGACHVQVLHIASKLQIPSMNLPENMFDITLPRLALYSPRRAPLLNRITPTHHPYSTDTSTPHNHVLKLPSPVTTQHLNAQDALPGQANHG